VNLKEIIAELELLAERLGFQVIYGTGEFRGGSCIFRDQTLLLINKRLPLEEKVSIFSRELALRDLKNIYVRPALREILERYNPDASH
jgi:hypothetical protein